MKIQRWLFWIICLGLISSCSSVQEIVEPPTDPEKPRETAKIYDTVPKFDQTGQVEPVTPDDFQDESLQVAQTDNDPVTQSSQPASFQAVVEKAEQGEADAQFKLGLMYFNGKVVSQNYSEGGKWFRKAAEQGHADAQFVLGSMYLGGKVVSQNYSEAVKWFRKAAEQGYADAQFVLGSMYLSGKGVTQNYTEVVKWVRKAAEQGHAEAQFRLGSLYISGKGVSQNDSEGIKWVRKAAD
jgi:TPR repeat protein